MIQEFINFYFFFFPIDRNLYASKMIYAHFVTLSRKKFREGNFSIILWNTINEIELVIAVSEVYIYIHLIIRLTKYGMEMVLMKT